MTILHLAGYDRSGIPGIHGACWGVGDREESAVSFRRALMSDEPSLLRSATDEPTAALTTRGRATGVLLGGNLDMIATAAGWVLPNLRGAVLLLEDVEK